jgi:hypothetical protein
VVLNSGVTPGRWYALLRNGSSNPASIEIKADMTYTGTPFAFNAGMWEPGGVRLNIKQGFDLGSDASGNRSMLWYSYTEDGTPTWYLAAGPAPVGNVWKARLKRFTNDGTLQQKVVVGWASLTALSEDEYIFSFTLFGDEGSDLIFTPFRPATCPEVEAVETSYYGVWSRPNIGVGGATVMVNANSQGFVHYIYDSNGNPIWLLGATALPATSGAVEETREVTMRQWSGFCPVCTGPAPTKQPVGSFTRDFIDESNMTWTLDYSLLPPLEGVINRTDDTGKLTSRVECQQP